MLTFHDLKVSIPEGQSGFWRVNHFTVAKNDRRTLTYKLHGRPIPPGQYTRLLKDGEYDPIMSDTPAEINDHLNFLYRAEGTILVNGLGLGVVLLGLLQKPQVCHIDVVEIDSDVIKLVWPTYKNETRLQLHQADAFTIQWTVDKRWDFVWHDIWPSICVDNLAEITKLKRKYARKTSWQGAWCEDWVRQLKRSNNHDQRRQTHHPAAQGDIGRAQGPPRLDLPTPPAKPQPVDHQTTRTELR